METVIRRTHRRLSTGKLQRNIALFRHRVWHFERLSNLLESTVCVDIGASHFPHPKWWVFLQSPNSLWLAIDPVAESLNYVEGWPWRCRVEAIPVAVGISSGSRTFYITNLSTGSSLRSPRPSLRNEYRFTSQDLSYFFPISEVQIETVSLLSILERFGSHHRFVLKLDTQGSEFEILESISPLIEAQRILAIECEVSLLHLPAYENSPRLWDVVNIMEGRGFELLQLDVMEKSTSSKLKAERGIVSEADAVFVLRREFLSAVDLSVRLQMLGVYITYKLFDEARSLLREDKELSDFIRKSDVKGRFDF